MQTAHRRAANPELSGYVRLWGINACNYFEFNLMAKKNIARESMWLSMGDNPGKY